MKSVILYHGYVGYGNHGVYAYVLLSQAASSSGNHSYYCFEPLCIFLDVVCLQIQSKVYGINGLKPLAPSGYYQAVISFTGFLSPLKSVTIEYKPQPMFWLLYVCGVMKQEHRVHTLPNSNITLKNVNLCCITVVDSVLELVHQWNDRWVKISVEENGGFWTGVEYRNYVGVKIIAQDRDGWAIASNRPMTAK